MKVLIIDDDDITRQILSSIIGRYGQTIEARNGEEALECYKEACNRDEPFDCIFLDIEMPELNGIDFLTLIRDAEENDPLYSKNKSKVLILSGHTDGDKIYDAYSLNCDSYLVKPIDAGKVKSELERLGIIQLADKKD